MGKSRDNLLKVGEMAPFQTLKVRDANLTVNLSMDWGLLGTASFQNAIAVAKYFFTTRSTLMLVACC